MGDVHADRAAVKDFWKQTEGAAASHQRQGEGASRFYIGATTAATGWFATNAPDRAVAAIIVLCLGVVGAGHVAWCHLRSMRIHRRARYLAGRYADLSGLSKADGMYTPDDEVLKVFKTGQPASGALFDGLAVLAVSCGYAAVLALLPIRS